VTHSTLTVAAFNPFTGGDAAFGPEMMAGCLAAANSVNAAGGVLGNKVACSAVDTRGDPADAVTAAAKMLATTSHLFGVLGPSSDEADATAPLINAAKIPMFADTGEASFDHTKLQYFWRMTPADDVLGYAMALWAKKQGYLRAAAVFGNDVGSQSVVPTLLKGYSALGGQMVSNQKIAQGQTSYQPEVGQLIAAKPQVIFTEASPQADATFLAELQQLGHMIPVISSDGRYVAFESFDPMTADDTDGVENVFLRDTCAGAPAGCTPSTILVSQGNAGSQSANGAGASSISGTGRFVIFDTFNSGGKPAAIFVRNTCIGAPAGCSASTTLVSVATGGAAAIADSRGGSLSADGRFIAFESDASNLVSGDTNNATDVFLNDTCAGAPAGCTASTTRLSVRLEGVQGNGASFRPVMSGDGRFVAFISSASNLAPGDTNKCDDVFLSRTGFMGP